MTKRRPLMGLVAILLSVTTGGCATSATASQKASAPSESAVAPSETHQLQASTQSPLATSSPKAPAVVIAPGEEWLLYAWPRRMDGGPMLFLARPDGTDAHVIASDVPGEHRAPSWSPDGSRIAFVVRSDQWPGAALWTSGADGTGARYLYASASGACAEGSFHPVWSPDATKLAFICYPDAKRATLSILDLVTLQKTDLTTVTWPEFLDNPVSWTHDGTTIAFDILKWDPTNQVPIGSVVATVPVAGGPVNRLSRFDQFFSYPDWSADDSRLVVNAYDLGSMHGIAEASNLYTIAADGSHLKQLTTASQNGHMRIGQPRWSSDGRKIWVSIAREWENWPDGTYKYGLGWIDPATGDVHELNIEGKGPHPRPVP